MAAAILSNSSFVRVILIFVLGIYPLGMVWPSGWQWDVGHSHYHMMIIGVYATLGVFLWHTRLS